MWRTQKLGLGPASPDPAPYLVLHRASLQRILRERAENLGAQIVLNANIESINIETAEPYIRLQGGHIYDADIILGADGEKSVCREKLLGRDDPLHSTGNLVYRFTVPAGKVRSHRYLSELADPPNVNIWLGPGSHAVSYLVKQGDVLNVALMLSQNKIDTVQYGVQKVEIQELREVLEEWDAKFGALLSIAQECSKWSLLQSEELDRWNHPGAKFSLIGDAAHAMMPCL